MVKDFTFVLWICLLEVDFRNTWSIKLFVADTTRASMKGFAVQNEHAVFVSCFIKRDSNPETNNVDYVCD